MKNRYSFAGLIYLILVASIVIAATIQPLKITKAYNSIQYSYKDTETLILNVKSGNIKIQSQEDKTLDLTIFYREDKPPHISKNNEVLEITLDEGNITAYLGIEVSQIKITVDTRTLFILGKNFNSTLVLRGKTTNALLNLANSNTTLKMDKNVGNIQIIASNTILNGNISVNIGTIAINMQTEYGGKILFSVNTGSANIDVSGFNVSKQKTKEGEKGIISRDPQLFCMNLYVDTGKIMIIIMYLGS